MGNGDAPSQKGAEHLRRMPVVAAMAKTWNLDRAEEFWTKLRMIVMIPKLLLFRKLHKWLLTHKVGAVKDASEGASNREMYLKCLLAWNTWRTDETEERYQPIWKPPRFNKLLDFFWSWDSPPRPSLFLVRSI